MATDSNSIINNVSNTTQKDIEQWVVNSVKVSLVKKFDNSLFGQGQENLRKTLLVPIYSISEFLTHIDTNAPELRTLLYKEITDKITELRGRTS